MRRSLLKLVLKIERPKGRPVVVLVVVVAATVVEYHSNCINIIVELDDLTGARFVLFFTVFSQRTCSKPWF